jgi:hypothetical protein
VVDGTTEHVGAKRLARSVARRGEPYTMGIDACRIEAGLSDHGYALRDHARTRELAERYGGAWCRTDEYLGVVTAERLMAREAGPPRMPRVLAGRQGSA